MKKIHVCRIYAMLKKCLSFSAALIFINLYACNPAVETSSNKKLLQLDSTNIAGWDFKPGAADEGSAYKVIQKNGLWMVAMPDGSEGEVDAGYLNRSFRHLLNLNTVSRLNIKKEFWDTLGVAENGSVVKVRGKDGGIIKELIIGNMFFYQDVKTTYYVREANDDKIYTVQQYLDGSIKAPASKLRKKELVPVTPMQMGDILFLNPEGINFILKKAGQLNWETDGILTDDSITVNYLKRLSALQIREFGQQPTTGVDLSIEIKTVDGTPPISLRASRKNSQAWVISSSANKGNFMEVNAEDIPALFPPKSFFLTSTKK